MKSQQLVIFKFDDMIIGMIIVTDLHINQLFFSLHI